jgi:hypothetical protein
MFDKILKIIDTTLHSGKVTIGNFNDNANLAMRCNLDPSELNEILSGLYELGLTEGEVLSYTLTTEDIPDALFTYQKDNFKIIFNKQSVE